MPFSAMTAREVTSGASAPLKNTRIRSTVPSRVRPRARTSANSGRSSAYPGPARMRAPGGTRRTYAPALAPRFWLRTRSTGSGRSARSSMAISAARARGGASRRTNPHRGHSRRRRRATAHRRSPRRSRRVRFRSTPPTGGGRDPGLGQAVGQPSGRSRVAIVARQPRRTRASARVRIDKVAGPHRRRGIGPQEDVARGRRRPPLNARGLPAERPSGRRRVGRAQDGFASTTASASRQPKSSRPRVSKIRATTA